jgi:hypothetical protein
MFLTELFEQQITKHAAFCFGRMNPPTVGHGQLIDVVAKASQGGDYFIFVSQTQDAKKNPLDYSTKVKFIKALFPDQASHVVYAPELKTIMQVASWLYNAGYRAVTFAAGSDRLDSFKKLLTDYNGKEGGNVYYKFDSINFVSSGDRDPDADGIAGVSASSAREAASQGNFELFAQATGAGKLAQPLYDAVRKGMLLESVTGKVGSDHLPVADAIIHKLSILKNNGLEELFKDHGEAAVLNSIRYVVREVGPQDIILPRDIDRWVDKVIELVTNKKSVAEGASGYIPKNKKEAKDPRWSNALTVDVHPDTPRKNMKALGLI